MVRKIRIKPTEHFAIQYTGELRPVKNFLGIRDARYDQVTREMIIGEPEQGNLRVISPGDWIIASSDNPQEFAFMSEEEFKDRTEFI